MHKTISRTLTVAGFCAEVAGEPPLDTPSLDTSFHDHEMAV